MKTALKKTVVTFKDSPIAGQEYIVKVTFTGYAGAGDANYTVKYGFATADSEIADNTALAKALADSLNKNLKDLIPLATAKAEGETLVIKEVEQPWEAGVKPFCVIPFEVSLMPIINKGVETVWGDVETSNSSDDGDIIINGKKIADAEWFHSGARGDMYRGFGYPHSVKTKLLADEDTAYDTLDIHYAYVGPNEGAQKSEKTITIAYPVGTTITTLTTALSTAGIEVVEAPTKG